MTIKTKRRDFFKTLGLAGMGIFTGARKGMASQATDSDPFRYPHAQHFNMSGYVAPRIDPVRIGVIGLGNRAPRTPGTGYRLKELRSGLCAM